MTILMQENPLGTGHTTMSETTKCLPMQGSGLVVVASLERTPHVPVHALFLDMMRLQIMNIVTWVSALFLIEERDTPALSV